jgi:hypothetical protein
MNRIAEQCCSSLQIALAHLALDTPPAEAGVTRLTIAPTMDDDASFELAMNQGDDHASRWLLRVPPSAADSSSFSFERVTQRFVATIIADALGTSEAEYERVRLAVEGPEVAAKVLISAHPLRELLKGFHPPDRFSELIRGSGSPSLRI